MLTVTNYTSQRAFCEAVLSKAEALCNAAPDYPEYDGEFSGTPCANMRDNAIEFYDFARTGYPATLTALRALLEKWGAVLKESQDRQDGPYAGIDNWGPDRWPDAIMDVIYAQCLIVNAALPEQERVDVPQ